MGSIVNIAPRGSKIIRQNLTPWPSAAAAKYREWISVCSGGISQTNMAVDAPGYTASATSNCDAPCMMAILFMHQ